MKQKGKISKMAIMWLANADKLINKDIKFFKEYDFIFQQLRGSVDIND